MAKDFDYSRSGTSADFATYEVMYINKTIINVHTLYWVQ